MMSMNSFFDWRSMQESNLPVLIPPGTTELLKNCPILTHRTERNKQVKKYYTQTSIYLVLLYHSSYVAYLVEDGVTHLVVRQFA